MYVYTGLSHYLQNSLFVGECLLVSEGNTDVTYGDCIMKARGLPSDGIFSSRRTTIVDSFSCILFL